MDKLLSVFWENHDPTQGNRQGNDHGSQYRSAIYAYTDDQLETAKSSRDSYQKSLEEGRKHGKITTEICKAGKFHYAHLEHQQYLDKNPGGYCGLKGTGVVCQLQRSK